MAMGRLRPPPIIPEYLSALRTHSLWKSLCGGHVHTPALAYTSSLDTDLTRNTRAPHFTPKHCLLCHMGLYKFEFEFEFILYLHGVCATIPRVGPLF